MSNLNQTNNDPLVSSAIGKLNSVEPVAWDTDARELWGRVCLEHGFNTGRSEADIEAAWKAAIRSMSVGAQTKFKKYLKIKKELKGHTSITAHEVDWPAMCIGGQTDSVSYSLNLLVEGE